MISTPDTESRKGFKKTKLGWIPEDWQLSDFKRTTKINQGLQIPIAERQLEKTDKNFFYITNEFLNPKSEKKFYVENPTENVICEYDDLLMTRTGNTGQVVRNVEGVFHNNFFKIKTTNDLDKQFLYQFLIENRTQNLILRLAGTSTIPDLNHGDFYRINLPLPPIPEQEAIANCLNTWDIAITKLDELIKAKQQLKKAFMQQLLSGRKRLPGFDGKWEEKRFDELFDEIKDKNDGGAHEPLSISAGKGFRSQREKFDRVIAGTSLSKYIQLKKGDFSYNKGNSKSYKMGCIYLLEDYDTALVPFVFISFRPTEKVDSHFYKHFFIDHGLDRQLKRIITSGARGDGLLNVSKKDFFKLVVPFPQKKEQAAIAKVLNTADQEIALLTTQRNQLQLQKKGLMQQLLTGKKRLKI